MVPDLFVTIDRAWNELALSPRAVEVRHRWVRTEPVLAQYADIREIVEAARDQLAPDRLHRDELQRALLRVAVRDADARLAMLFVLRPGLSDVARRYSPFWGDEDADAMVVELALERFAAGGSQSRRPAAAIVHGVRNRLWRLRLVQIAEAHSTGVRVPLRADMMEPQEQLPASELVLALVTEALERGYVSARGARLILLQRLFDVPSNDLAELERRDVRAIRKYRNRAESALTAVADVVP
jgi:hypothetical protein